MLRSELLYDLEPGVAQDRFAVGRFSRTSAAVSGHVRELKAHDTQALVGQLGGGMDATNTLIIRNDSAVPMTTSVPLIPKPPCTALIASPFVTVARITFAPPSFRSSAAGSCAWLSM